MPLIEIQNFSKAYGTFMAVKNINITVAKGEIVGFVGKNGAGKTTTIRSMMNLIAPTQGKITINGLDSVKDSKKIKHSLSYMPGDCTFYENITVLELLKLCIQFSHEKMDRISDYSDYFELDVHKRISELSLGNRKKVSIIQALLKNNEILLLDEPTSGLDPLMQIKFFELLRNRKKRETTIFLSSHNLSEIEKYCDRAIIIKEGEIVDTLDMHTREINHRQMVSYTTKNGLSKNFEFTGDANRLINDLSKLELESVEIKTMTMEDEFMKYYREEDQDG